MPITPEQVLNHVRTSVVEKIDSMVTRILTDPKMADAVKHTSNDSISYWVTIPAPTLNDTEKEQIRKLYSSVGWNGVDVKNSSDDGERPGLVSIKLSMDLNNEKRI